MSLVGVAPVLAAGLFLGLLALLEIGLRIGQRTVIDFSGWQRNPSFGKDVFRYSPPKGVDVIGEGG